MSKKSIEKATEWLAEGFDGAEEYGMKEREKTNLKSDYRCKRQTVAKLEESRKQEVGAIYASKDNADGIDGDASFVDAATKSRTE